MSTLHYKNWWRSSKTVFFPEATDLAQSDSPSSFLFAASPKYLPSIIGRYKKNGRSFPFYGRLCKLRFSGFQLRQVRIRFHIAVMELGLMVSTGKTMAVKFNRGGVIAGDTLSSAKFARWYVNRFSYPGQFIVFNGHNLHSYITYKYRNTLTTSRTITTPSRLSLVIAFPLFNLTMALA